MTTKAVPDSRDETAAPEHWQPLPERAPSLEREEGPSLARALIIPGMFCLAVGVSPYLGSWLGKSRTLIGYGTGNFMLALSLLCFLYHAVRDRDVQIRRVYALLGMFGLVLGVVLGVVALVWSMSELFLPWGFVFMAVALFFLVAVVRNETEPVWHDGLVKLLGAAGLLLSLVGFIGGNVRADFLLPYGLVLAVLGLGYWWAFLGVQSESRDLRYHSGVALAALGLVVFLIALARSVFETRFLVPTGVLLGGMSALYVGLAAGMCSDNRLIVLTRRELAACFFSPLAYIVVFGLTVVGWWQFTQFVVRVRLADQFGSPLAEPVLRFYIIDWFPVICVLFGVPVLTMHLMSEEKRTGTLEMLLTTPVDETTVVLSKFLATWIFYLTAFAPWGLFLVGLRWIGGEPFDYRPLLSFFFTLAFTGANFLGMGLFFSSITRNQLAAAILTFAGMVLLTGIYFAKQLLFDFNLITPQSSWDVAITYVSYVDLWISSMSGKMAPQFLLFHLSAAIFWLFLSVKVLEARKWS
jgi:ABC-type transport system involved in multi-copper enzyme maturation permease subunit